MNSYQLARIMDCLLIDQNMSSFGLIQMANVCKESKIRSIIAFSNGIPVLKNTLRGTNTLINAIVGYPYGQELINNKVYEANLAYQAGADEVSFVPSFLAIRDRNHTYIEEEMSRMMGVAQRYGRKMNIIINPKEFSADELSKVCRATKKYGFSTLLIMDDDLTEDDIIIIKTTTNREVKLEAIGNIDFERMMSLAKSGISHFALYRPELLIRGYQEKYGK